MARTIAANVPSNDSYRQNEHAILPQFSIGSDVTQDLQYYSVATMKYYPLGSVAGICFFCRNIRGIPHLGHAPFCPHSLTTPTGHLGSVLPNLFLPTSTLLWGSSCHTCVFVSVLFGIRNDVEAQCDSNVQTSANLSLIRFLGRRARRTLW